MIKPFFAGDEVTVGSGRTRWQIEKVGESLTFLVKIGATTRLSVITGTDRLKLIHRPTQEELT